MKKKWLCFLTGLFAVSLMGCESSSISSSASSSGELVPDEGFTVDKSRVFGMDDIYWQEYSWDHISFTQEHKLFKALGVKSIRFWAHATWMLKDPTTTNDAQYAIARNSLNEIKDEGYQIIGMNHGSFKNGYKGSTNWDKATAKPPRDLTPGSKYMQWLEDYKTSWKSLVQLFPEITYWEIDNETNNTDFMSRVGGGQFSQEQMAEITYDMMYWGSLGIHEGNPQAKTVMGGLIMTGLENFLNLLYDLIESKEAWQTDNPDDFFQVACWHPYMGGFNKRSFISMNNRAYKIVKEREGHDKKVFFTEAGINDSKYNYNEQKGAQYVKEMYEACRDDLYYLETLHYYRMWDLDGARYGLFTDPTETREDPNPPNRAAPKPAAYAYQEIAGGSGDLTTYEKYILEHGTCADV